MLIFGWGASLTDLLRGWTRGATQGICRVHGRSRGDPECWPAVRWIIEYVWICGWDTVATLQDIAML